MQSKNFFKISQTKNFFKKIWYSNKKYLREYIYGFYYQRFILLFCGAVASRFSEKKPDIKITPPTARRGRSTHTCIGSIPSTVSE